MHEFQLQSGACLSHFHYIVVPLQKHKVKDLKRTSPLEGGRGRERRGMGDKELDMSKGNRFLPQWSICFT